MEKFTDAASRLAGMAGLLLGWRPGEFWAATPGELDAIFAAARGDGADGAAGAVPDGETIAKLMEMYPDG
ncbi:phage tail assembly chaperone [Sphingobium phenoxybenzoativorans]|uniref:Phage tail assembly chaperone n=1 Tax=Sphingobium phenoxybenzoativorans TaxID=1592790 RepID=A0A975K7N2_9SPHN|nr:phage tail assembly chaperone [Sphingobium phenoxybenzoativorans]QUT06299.1 phage tail assembly chaperone [Sphingobium phenoxybenzoativorans]